MSRATVAKIRGMRLGFISLKAAKSMQLVIVVSLAYE